MRLRLTAQMGAWGMGLALTTCASGVGQRAHTTDAGVAVQAEAGGDEPRPADASTGDEAATPAVVMGITAGVAVEDITPPWPTYEESYDVLLSTHYRKVEVKALAISDQSTPVVIVTADICDFCTEISQPIYDGVKALGLEPRQIILNSSHIHSAPAACAVDVLDVKAHPIARYQTFLVERIISVIKRAVADMKPATLGTSEATCDICVNRDGSPHTAGSIIANPGGIIDRRVRVLQMRDVGSDKLRAAVALFGCHPSDIGQENDGSNPGFGGDYFGFGRDEAERQYPGVVVLTAQGTGGDVRLNSFDPKDPAKFSPVTPAQNMARNKEYGRRFGAAIAEALGQKPAPVLGRIRAGASSVMLPEEEADSRDLAVKIANGEEGPPLRPTLTYPWAVRYGKWLLAKYDSGTIKSPNAVGPYSMRVIHIGDDFTMAGIDGEIFTCIGRQIEARLQPRRTFVFGYTNDVSAYVMCSENFAQGEGGYEINVYYWWLWQTARFKPTVDTVIVDETVDLASRILKP